MVYTLRVFHKISGGLKFNIEWKTELKLMLGNYSCKII